MPVLLRLIYVNPNVILTAATLPRIGSVLVVPRRLPLPIPFRIIHSLLEGTGSCPVGSRPLFLLGEIAFGRWQWETSRLRRGFTNWLNE
jgi:hypothetical protein